MVLSGSSIAIPEQGQIVRVRQRRFVVMDVNESAIREEVIYKDRPPQHLISLSSIEDDALGETLQVIWEIEPDAKIIEKVGLPEPTGFDSPRKFDAFVNAVKWGAISSSDVKALQAPFRSGITIEDYQLDPLVRAIQMPRANLLVADDVGLGKTIEAGLIVQELILRNRARTVLVVCPSSLQIQWRDQMRDKFGLEFRIIDSEMMRTLRRTRGLHTNPWSHFPRLITSIDFLKRDRPMRLFRELLPSEGEPKYPRRFDILIVDEAHNVAPMGSGKYATDSQRTTAIRELAPNFEHKLFLTATPHNGYKESFTALLELLDDQRFARGVDPDRQQLQAIMVRRLKSELPAQFDGTPRFPKRHVEPIEVEYSETEKQVHAWLKEYAELRLSNPKDAQERYVTEFMMKLLKKRLFSSPAAFLLSLEQHKRTLEKKKESETTYRPSIGILRQQLEQADDVETEADLNDPIEEAVHTATNLFRPLLARERELMDNMMTWARNAALLPDSKTKQLLKWLLEVVKPNSAWSNERVVIFTEYRATMNYLQAQLAMVGLTGDGRTLTLFGGMEPDKREVIKAAFQTNPEKSKVRILLATDAASEGIDLQNHCYRIVHMEIPWNPNRLEQRNGRLDRHGQKHDVYAYHFVSRGYRHRDEDAVTSDSLAADLEFLFRAVQKIEQIREDLGKVGPVIAQQVEEAMLGHRRKLETSYAERESEPIRKMLKFERDLQAQIARQVEQLQDTRRAMNFSSDNTLAIVETALEIANQNSLTPVKLEGGLEAYQVPPLTSSWAASTEGLSHPLTGEIRPIVFDQSSFINQEDVVLAHINHRLVQMSLRLLRAEVWSPSTKKGLHRITARVVSDLELSDPAIIASARLVVLGGDHNRLHEEVIYAGGFLKEGKFVRMNVGQVQSALSAETMHEPSDGMKTRLLGLYSQISPQIMTALEARMKDRMDGVNKSIVERQLFECESIEAILIELAKTIKKELDEPEDYQLTLFSLEEKDQLNRNIDALRRRLNAIPKEIIEEKKIIENRYADIQTRMFPVAVQFLVPEKMAR